MMITLVNYMLTTQKIADYKEKLEALKRELTADISGEEEHLDFGSDIESGEEETDEAEELGNTLATKRVLKERIGYIDAALQKIKSGGYGMCEQCHGPIAENVLDAAPESLLCEKCKSSKKP